MVPTATKEVQKIKFKNKTFFFVHSTSG